MKLYVIGALGVVLLGLSACGGPKYPKCDQDEDCKDGEFCINGMCQQCRTDSDCDAGEQCVSGACERRAGYCAADADCDPGQECKDNSCVDKPKPEEPEVKNDDSCRIQPVYFGFDDDSLNTSARDTLSSNLACAKDKGVKKMQLTGHCDPRGTEEYNLALGDRRAKSVRDYLISLGLDSDKVSYTSMGEEMASDAESEDAYAAQRRVEVTVKE